MKILIIKGCRVMIFDENCGHGHPVLIYINNRLECSGFEKKDKMNKNDIEYVYVGIHCKLIHYWIGYTPARILFTTQ